MTRIALTDGSSASIEQLVWLTAAIIVAMLVSAAFYASMSARDAVVVLADRVANGRHWSPSTRRMSWVLAVLVVTPILVALWATFLYVLLVFLEPPDRLREVAVICGHRRRARIISPTPPRASPRSWPRSCRSGSSCSSSRDRCSWASLRRGRGGRPAVEID